MLVVDDGSSDGTGPRARAAGAQVVTHRTNKGKAQAMMTGSFAVRNREISELAPGEQARHRALLFIDGDLEDSAVNTHRWPGRSLPAKRTRRSRSCPRRSVRAAGSASSSASRRRASSGSSGFQATQPLSGMRRGLTREAFTATQPFAPGWGVETGMTIDLVWAGMRVREVECDLHHRVTGRDLRAQLHRAAQYRDVARALAARELRGRVSGGRRPGRETGGALS